MIESSVVTTKGQIVIPVRLREELGIKVGMRVFLEARGADIVVHPATQAFYEKTFGILRGGGLLKTLQGLRQKEKRREESKLARP